MPDSPAPAAFLESADGTRWPVSSYDQAEDYDLVGMAFTNFRITFTLHVAGLPAELWTLQLARIVFPRDSFEIRTSLLAIEAAVAREGPPAYVEVKATLHDSDRVSYVSTSREWPEPVEQPVDFAELTRFLSGGAATPPPATFTAEGGIHGKAKRRRK